MNLQTEKLNLIQAIIDLQDKNLVLELKKFLEISLQKAEEPEMKPMSLETFYAKIEASEKAVKEGRVYSHEDVKKMATSWGRKK